MGDVVLKLPLHDAQESKLFGTFLNRFLESFTARAEQWGADGDAPYLMVRTDPQHDRVLKVLTFQETDAAQAFDAGWRQAAGAATGSRRPY